MDKSNWINPKSLHSRDKEVYRSGLRLINSLTGKEEEFITISGTRTLTWYMWGPTVYDASHLGHARTYLCFDIIRRVMTNYFGYDIKVIILFLIKLCMNITDIDDKIIIRSNEQKVNFAEFAKMWENDYFKDMSVLNVSYPNFITRVSEYIPEIIQSIKTIIENGYAYESNGSVYFDIEKFTKDKHFYKKLTPGSGTKEEAEEGEGKLSVGTDKDKKNPGDFALWKKSKENEPFWESSWGNGRPGWHIECSAMCKEIFGDKLDIHCGGVDLKFPHHDNEIAQTEAIYNSQQVIIV